MHAAVVAATEGVSVERVLDVGTGPGEAVRRILDAYPDARAVSIAATEAPGTEPRQRPYPERVEYIEQSLTSPLPDGPFDIAEAVLTLHHLPREPRVAVLREIGKRLSPGGRVILGEMILPSLPVRIVPLAYPPRLRKYLRTARADPATLVGPSGSETLAEGPFAGEDIDTILHPLDTAATHLAILREAGFDAHEAWQRREYAVFVGERS